MKTRTILYADKDKVLTNGEIYGTQIFLAEDAVLDDWYEITVAEYKEISAKMEETEDQQ